MSVGYSGTALPNKLGLKDGQRIAFLGLPDHLAGLSKSATFALCIRENSSESLPDALDIVHAFVLDAATLSRVLDSARKSIAANGMIWISWPKKSSKVPTDVTEDVVRAIAIEKNLVDVKVCAVDEVWSGLKLVIPKALR